VNTIAINAINFNLLISYRYTARGRFSSLYLDDFSFFWCKFPSL
jgi:hypothetical protein